MDDYWDGRGNTLSAADVAHAIQVAPDTIYRWINAGHLPAHRIGTAWILFTAEVRVWLLSHSNQPLPTDIAPAVDLLADYPEVLNADDLIRFFDRSKRTIYTWLQNGVIPAFHVEDRWVTHKIDLARALAATSNQTRPTEPELAIV